MGVSVYYVYVYKWIMITQVPCVNATFVYTGLDFVITITRHNTDFRSYCMSFGQPSSYLENMLVASDLANKLVASKSNEK